MKFLVALIALAVFVMACKAEDAAAANEQQQQPDVQEDESQAMDKRIPHPSWRNSIRVQHFQQGEMPSFSPRRFMSNGPRRFYRYARRPFSLDLSDW